MRLATRRSLKTVHGVTPALRPRLPSREASVPLKLRMQGSWKIPVGENFEVVGLFPIAVHAGFSKVLGRPVSEDNWRLSPLPARMLNGRPELNSIRGATVQLLKSWLAKPSPPSLPVWETPLKTKRWRWSKVEVERSALGK